ncbi:MAG TPA: hypothetical protein VKF38_01465 [Anaerolineaceae bacterium]|nr:hypothetical protein [Anaerolineaceae bacterium]
MAETFDCPKCGAPINFEPDQHLDQETMPCPYCGESIIIPANLRRSTPIPDSTVVMKSTGRSPSGLLVVGFVTVLIVCAVAIFAITSLRSAQPQASGEKAPTNPAAVGQTILGTVQSMLATDIPTQADISTPTSAESPTPTVDITSTAEAANNLVFQQQINWPVLLQEKFINNARGWDVGTTNDSFALSDFSIAGGKYTWQITSKKSMLTYTAPQMPAQTDLLVSADLQLTTTNPNPQDEAGIIFRYSDKDNTFYFFGVNPVGTYLLTMFDGTNFDDLIPNNQTDLLKPNQVNHLAVSMQGDQILLIINNAVADSYQDSRLSSGYAGLAANLADAGEDATLIFTNFYVHTPKK